MCNFYFNIFTLNAVNEKLNEKHVNYLLPPAGLKIYRWKRPLCFFWIKLLLFHVKKKLKITVDI